MIGEIVYPNFGPWKENPKNYLWIKIVVLNPPTQTALARSSQSVVATPEGTVFRFLAPRNITFAISHEWSNYENITSRLANVIANYTIPIADISSGISNVLKNLFGGSSGPSAVRSVSSTLMKMLNTEVVNYRVDSTQVYKSSEFLSYIFEFNFGLGPNKKVSSEDMWFWIKKLMKFSSPEKSDDGILIKPPNIFSVYSWPDDNFLKIKYASIRTIQNEINDSHFYDGYPSEFRTTITFTDITPLFKSSFDTGSGIDIITAAIR